MAKSRFNISVNRVGIPLFIKNVSTSKAYSTCIHILQGSRNTFFPIKQKNMEGDLGDVGCFPN